MTKDEIINKMIEAMPFRFCESSRPYIREAMDLHTKEVLKSLKTKLSAEACSECGTDFEYDWQLEYNKCPKCGCDKAAEKETDIAKIEKRVLKAFESESKADFEKWLTELRAKRML